MAPPKTSSPPWENGVVILFLLVFLVVNLLTGARYPFVWIDEVMFSDPAINLYLGHGFTSTAWYQQGANEFWAGNVPLHSALLYLWIKVFGLSILAVRSLGYVYLMGVMVLVWRACVRLDLIHKPWARLLVLGLMVCGYAMIFSYRSGRSDCLVMLLVCAAAYVHTRECWRQRIFGVMALGALMPWAGLQALPLIAVGGFVLFLFLGKKVLPLLMSLYAGAGIGAVALVGFYHAHGVWDRFMFSVHAQTAVGFFGWLARGEIRHSNLVPKDFSFMTLFALAILFWVWLGMNKERTEQVIAARTSLMFGIIYSVLLTAGLILSGKFPTYYGWMTYVPLTVCVCRALSLVELKGVPRLACGGLLALTMGVGVGLHGVTAAADWNDRDYRHVEKLVRENVTATDRVFGDFPAYYASKQTAAQTFMPPFLTAISEEEKKKLTVLVIAPKTFGEVTNVLGGEWIDTGKHFMPESAGFWANRRYMGFLSMENYELAIYRRAGGSLIEHSHQ